MLQWPCELFEHGLNYLVKMCSNLDLCAWLPLRLRKHVGLEDSEVFVVSLTSATYLYCVQLSIKTTKYSGYHHQIRKFAYSMHKVLVVLAEKVWPFTHNFKTTNMFSSRVTCWLSGKLGDHTFALPWECIAWKEGGAVDELQLLEVCYKK